MRLCTTATYFFSEPRLKIIGEENIKYRKLFGIYQWILWNLVTRPFFVESYLRRKFPFFSTPRSQPFPKPPFIVLANHGTFFDPWIIGSYSIAPIGFMTNDDGFREGMITRWYLRSIGAFPKKKGASDFRAIKTALDMLKNGKSVCIFPEGQTTWDGETQLLYLGIEKLVRRALCPLVTVRLQGNFLMKPWWARSVRKGRILVTAAVHSVEKIRQLPDEKLFGLIKQSIYQNDVKDPENLVFPFSGDRLAEGLERFVWICLKCGAEDSLLTHGNNVSCNECGFTIEMDAHCRLNSDEGLPLSCRDLKDWAEFHKSRVKEKIRSNARVLTKNLDVTLQRENDRRRFVDVDRGELILGNSSIIFKGSDVKSEWPVEEIEDCVIQKKDIFEFRYGEIYNRFLFRGKSPMKWVYYIRYIKGYEKCEIEGHL